jgi:hypothetical protein
MPKAVKSLVFITITVLLSLSINAQLKLPSLSATANDIKKVIENYPDGFASISGDLIVQNEQSADYQCTLKVNGAEESFITKYPAKRNISNWQAVMLTTESFEKAKQKFKSLYNQLNNLTVSIAQKNYKIKGDNTAPSEELKFSSAVFSLTPQQEAVNKLRVEVIIQFAEPMVWKVRLLVYDKEREDNEKGAEKD